jgi:hypothetical protein
MTIGLAPRTKIKGVSLHRYRLFSTVSVSTLLSVIATSGAVRSAFYGFSCAVIAFQQAAT